MLRNFVLQKVIQKKFHLKDPEYYCKLHFYSIFKSDKVLKILKNLVNLNFSYSQSFLFFKYIVVITKCY